MEQTHGTARQCPATERRDCSPDIFPPASPPLFADSLLGQRHPLASWLPESTNPVSEDLSVYYAQYVFCHQCITGEKIRAEGPMSFPSGVAGSLHVEQGALTLASLEGAFARG